MALVTQLAKMKPSEFQPPGIVSSPNKKTNRLQMASIRVIENGHTTYMPLSKKYPCFCYNLESTALALFLEFPIQYIKLFLYYKGSM
jgi:hypothetical protein